MKYGKNTERKDTEMERKELYKPCRTCKYRIYIPDHYGPKTRYNSVCDYFDKTGTQRNCTPTDDGCDKYEPKIII